MSKQPINRVSCEDLAFAAEWLRSYEAAPDDDGGERAERVAAWIDAERSRREVAAYERLRRGAKLKPTPARHARGTMAGNNIDALGCALLAPVLWFLLTVFFLYGGAS